MCGGGDAGEGARTTRDAVTQVNKTDSYTDGSALLLEHVAEEAPYLGGEEHERAQPHLQQSEHGAASGRGHGGLSSSGGGGGGEGLGRATPAP